MTPPPRDLRADAAARAQVYADAVTSDVEAVAFLRCPPDARVKVDVPLHVQGDDASPGLRKGGTINTMRRKVRCWCLGAAVPPVRAQRLRVEALAHPRC